MEQLKDLFGLQTAKRSFTFARNGRNAERVVVGFVSKPLSGRSLLQGEIINCNMGHRHVVSKPLSGRSLLQGLPLKRRVFDGFGRLFFALSANLPFTLDSLRII